MPKKSTLTLIISLVVLVAVVVTGGIFYRKAHYTTVHPKLGKVVEAIYGLGKVKTRTKYDVKVGIMTTVSELYVKEGEKVKKGQRLIRFKDSGAFKAPFDGLVTLIQHHQDETVLPQVTVLSLEDSSDLYIEVSLEQNSALRVKKGQTARILFESLRGEKHTGIVEAIFPREDEFIAHLEVKGLPQNVLTGMTADVAIVVGEKEDVLLIPISAISDGRVTIKNEGKRPRKVEVTVGTVDGHFAEIKDGEVSLKDSILIPKKD